MRKTNPYKFDVLQFIADIRGRLNERPTNAELARQTGISEITFSRMNRGFQPSMDVFMELCSVFELDPGAYFVTRTVFRKRRNGKQHPAAS